MAFCDFCPCETCQLGNEPEFPGLRLTHALTADGRWICDVCYLYDQCVDAQRKANQPRNPCADRNCEHRPKIVGPWTKQGKTSS